MRWLTETQSQLGVRRLKRLDVLNASRHRLGVSLGFRLFEIPGIQFISIPPWPEPVYLRLPFYVLDRDQRERLFSELWSAGIGVGKMYQKPLYEYFPDLARSSFLGAEFIARHQCTYCDQPAQVSRFDLSGQQRTLLCGVCRPPSP